MKNRHIEIFLLAMFLAFPSLAALYDAVSRTAIFPHERILPIVRILSATPPPEDGMTPASWRRFFRVVLEAAEPWELSFLWEAPSGTFSIGMDRRAATACFTQLNIVHSEARISGVVCGQSRYGRWALGVQRVAKGGLPWNWWWFSWPPLLPLVWILFKHRQQRRQEAQLVKTARALSQGGVLPHLDPQAPAAEALAVMAVAIREREERLAAQLRTIEEQNQEILRNKEKLITQEKIVTVGHLAAGLAHELGNPLASLIAHIEWLAETSTEPMARKHFDMMKTETARMDSLLRRLLQLARGEPQGNHHQPVVDTITSAVEVFRHQKWCTNVEFQIETDAVAGLWVQADLKSILVNLLLNAAQSINGQGRVTVRASRKEKQIHLEIADTGPGVPEELAHTIFEPFFTTKAPGTGTGLGLSVSRMLAQQAGGKLFCIPNAGGLFVLELPIVLENSNKENPNAHQ